MLDTRITAAVVLPTIYVFSTQTVADCYCRRSKPNLDKSVNSYTLNADPRSRGNSGLRGFYTDQGLVIRANATGTASATHQVLN
jgi:hypothetical protein